jgi:CubicO group peptidase (beta-lactamase class C family)
MKIKLILLLTFVFAINANAQEIDFGKFDSYVKKSMRDFNMPGLAIGVIQNGDIVFQQGYGVSKVGEPQRISTNSMFGIASLSKAFTAASIGILVEDGKLNWDDKVTKHLPNWKLIDPVVTNMMSIEDLLCHRSGLKTFDGDLLWYGSNYSREEIITRIQHLPLSYEFRNGFGYQNIMFITAGEVIAKVSGMTWDKFVDTRILNPLGMTQTISSITKYKENTKIAYPHLKRKPQQLLNYDNSGATAALNSNVVDMMTWTKLWLNQGIHHGDTLLQASTVRKIFSVQNPLSVSGFDASIGTHFKGYGFGWFLMDYNGKKVVHHGGGLPGYITKVVLVPEEKMGIVILSNDMSSICTALMYKLLDEAFGEAKRDWSKDFSSYSKRSDSLSTVKTNKQDLERKTETMPSAPLESYVGTYSDKFYGNATISIEGKGKKAKLKLVLEPAKALFTATCEHWENDSFVFKFNDEFLPRGFANFKVESGKVSGFTIDLPNPDFHFSNLNFMKK